MKRLLITAALLSVPVMGEEALPAPGVREKLRGRIVEMLPPAPVGAMDAKPRPESPVLVLEPMVVSESRGVRELEKTLACEKQRHEAGRFTLTKGGLIYGSERLEFGSWWTPDTGWQFLKIKW